MDYYLKRLTTRVSIISKTNSEGRFCQLSIPNYRQESIVDNLGRKIELGFNLRLNKKTKHKHKQVLYYYCARNRLNRLNLIKLKEVKVCC